MATHEQLEAKVEGTIKALEKMTAKERELAPSGTFGTEYNKIRNLVSELYPDLNDLLPPPVEVQTIPISNKLTFVRYVEIHSYYEQIQKLLYLQN